MTPQRSDSPRPASTEQPRTAAGQAAMKAVGGLHGHPLYRTILAIEAEAGQVAAQAAAEAILEIEPIIEAEAGAASPAEPLRAALGKWVTAGFSNEAVDQRLYHADAVYKAALLTSILVDAENDDQMGVEYQPEALAEYIAARIAVPPAVTLLRQISLAPAGYLADGTSVREAASRFLAAQPSPEPAEPEGTQR